MRVIITEWIPPTNTKGARIKASGINCKIIKPYPHDENENKDAHKRIADELAKARGYGDYVGIAPLPDERAML